MKFWSDSKTILCVLCMSMLALSNMAHADANRKLTQLLEQDWEYQLRHNPVDASSYGDLRYNRAWKDLSLAALEKEYKHAQEIIRQLQAIDTTSLTEANRINHALYLREQTEHVEAYKLGMHYMPMSMRSGVQTLYSLTSGLPLRTVEHYNDWLARLEGIPQLLEQTQILMQKGVDKGITQPQIIMRRVVKQLETLTPSDPTKSPFYQDFKRIPGSIDQQTQQQLQAKAKKIIQQQVTPAYQRFADFFVNQYLSACREVPGIHAATDGKAIYEYTARHFTTTDLSPKEIHQIGLDEVARIRNDMQKIVKKVKFKGSLDEFIHWLRTDPQFFYETPEELYHAYLAVSKRLDPTLVGLFGKLPRTPYGVKPIPDAIAPDTTTAYYQPLAGDGSRAGFYFVNLYKPESRPKWEMEVLSMHEAVPGHHLQLALATEIENVPEFRKYARFTAYVEGWALYSERLGYDMGMYQDPYSQFGQLTYDMWRAVRLVVDTGIHYFGWSREKAINYFKANAPKSEQDIINEIDRYIGWPGQALAYKIGQLQILKLRATAEKALGDQFDIRAFHDTLLGTGAVPLDVLEQTMLAWIEQEKTK